MAVDIIARALAARAAANIEGKYTSLNKLDDYLYDASYINLNYDYATQYLLNHNTPITPAGCTSIRKGNLVGRNFDWLYNEQVEFVVHTPHLGGRYATVCISSMLPHLTKDFVASGADSEDYILLPFRAVDGINEEGLMITTNVVPADHNNDEWVIPTDDVTYTLSSSMLIRYLLDYCATAEDAVQMLVQHLKIKLSPSLRDMNYEVHYMISDATNTYLVEFNHDNDNITRAVILDMNSTGSDNVSGKPYMTNYLLENVIFNDDGRVYTPATSDFEHTPTITNHITPYGCGLERYNLIAMQYQNLSDISSLQQLLQRLAYTNTYQNTTSPIWYTELVGGDLTVDSGVEAFRPVLTIAQEAFINRSRDPASPYYGTWQTVHSAVYDLQHKSVIICVQENFEQTFVVRLDNANIDIPVTNAVIKGDGNGGLTEAVSNTDYSTPAGVAQQIIDAMPSTPANIDTTFTYNADTVTMWLNYLNFKTRETSTISKIIQLANADSAGLMSPSSVVAISTLIDKVNALEGTTVRLLYTDTTTPTASIIQQFVISKGYTDPTVWPGIAVVIAGSYHIWHYYSQDGWIDDGEDTVSQFTNNTPGTIKGANTDGKVYAEDDGTGSVVGWDQLKNQVNTTASNLSSLANIAVTVDSHLNVDEGKTQTNNSFSQDTIVSHAEGEEISIVGAYNHAEGYKSSIDKTKNYTADDVYSDESDNSFCSHAEGNATMCKSSSSHTEGKLTKTEGNCSHAEGYATVAGGANTPEDIPSVLPESTDVDDFQYHKNSHAEGAETIAYGHCAHAEGRATQANGGASHSEGCGTIASGPRSHAEGSTTQAAGSHSHAEGLKSQALSKASHVEGSETKAFGEASHAEGRQATANGWYSHAEGYGAIAGGESSHAEGFNTAASGKTSHAEGANTIAGGSYSHAEGYYTTASGDYSHASGDHTHTDYDSQFVVGSYNKKSEGRFIVGVGSDGAEENAFESGKLACHDFIKIGNSIFTEDQLNAIVNNNKLRLLSVKSTIENYSDSTSVHYATFDLLFNRPVHVAGVDQNGKYNDKLLLRLKYNSGTQNYRGDFTYINGITLNNQIYANHIKVKYNNEDGGSISSIINSTSGYGLLIPGYTADFNTLFVGIGGEKLDSNITFDSKTMFWIPSVNYPDASNYGTVIDSAYNTSINNLQLPSVTPADAGKILIVDTNGKWVAKALPVAEENSFGGN